MAQPKYVIVIPAKNEEASLAETLKSVAGQSIKPEICLIVDDGSDDKTYSIAIAFSEKHSFIRCIKRKNKNNYSLGGHVINVFEYGRGYVDSMSLDYDYIIKLDADLSFDSNIIENMFSRVNANEWAIFSGTPFVRENKKIFFENSPEWHSHGQFKAYNRKFLEQISKLPKSLGWDTADNIIALSKGWKTIAFKDIHYEMTRRVGGKYSLERGRMKHGIGCYILGYNPLYFLLVIGHDLIRPPIIIGSIAMIKGYLSAVLSQQKRILNTSQQKLLRKLLWKSLLRRLRNQEFELFQKIKNT